MFMSNLSILVRHSRKFSERALQEYGIGFPEQLILMHLARFQNVNQDTIANCFMIDKGSIAKTISKLEEKEMIKKVENPNNKRENLITIAAKGADVLSLMYKALEEWNTVIFEGLSDDDIAKVEELTGIMAMNVAKIEGKEWSNLDENAK